MAIDNTDLLDCFVHLPAAEGIPFDLDYQSIWNAQVGDACLEALHQDKPASFVEQLLAPDVRVTCYIPEPNAPWKINLPTNLLNNAIKRYHLALGHLGQNRLYDTIHMHFFIQICAIRLNISSLDVMLVKSKSRSSVDMDIQLCVKLMHILGGMLQ